MTLLAATGASAQVLGTFAWRMEPYCNVITLTLTQTPGGFAVDGSDNQCGAAKLAGAAGMALFNPDGTVGLEFTIVTAPSAKAVHVSASVNPGTGSGPWTDSVGHSGTFQLGAPGTGSPRPLGPAPVEVLVAKVSATGTILAGSGATAAARIGTGSYEVQFNRNVSQCAYSASVFDVNRVAHSVQPRIGNVNAVFLMLGNFVTGFSVVDGAFDLMVFCPGP